MALEWAREEAQPGIEEQLERIENEAVRLNALIGQLLSLSHMESATSLPAKQCISVSHIVEQLLPDMEYEAHGRNCNVTFVGAESQGDEVMGNPELLGRAIENVIRNAIAYTAEGTTVEIQLSRQQLAGSKHVVLKVKDHGGRARRSTGFYLPSVLSAGRFPPSLNRRIRRGACDHGARDSASRRRDCGEKCRRGWFDC